MHQSTVAIISRLSRRSNDHNQNDSSSDKNNVVTKRHYIAQCSKYVEGEDKSKSLWKLLCTLHKNLLTQKFHLTSCSVIGRKNSRPAISDRCMKVCLCLVSLSLKPNIFLKYGFFKKLFFRMNLWSVEHFFLSVFLVTDN